MPELKCDVETCDSRAEWTQVRYTSDDTRITNMEVLCIKHINEGSRIVIRSRVMPRMIVQIMDEWNA